jgi:hypothetical protein
MRSFIHYVTSRSSVASGERQPRFRMNLQHLIKTCKLVKDNVQDEKFACKFSLVRIAPLAGRIMDHTDMCVLCIQRNKDTSRT